MKHRPPGFLPLATLPNWCCQNKRKTTLKNSVGPPITCSVHWHKTSNLPYSFPAS